MTERTITVGSYRVEDEPSIKRAGPIRVGEGVLPSRYVLRALPDNPVHPWVTHLEVLRLEVTEQEGGRVVAWFRHRDFSQGNYFTDKGEAEMDFEKRSK